MHLGHREEQGTLQAFPVQMPYMLQVGPVVLAIRHQMVQMALRIQETVAVVEMAL
jgi:hypothetical protein